MAHYCELLLGKVMLRLCVYVGIASTPKGTSSTEAKSNSEKSTAYPQVSLADSQVVSQYKIDAKSKILKILLKVFLAALKAL